SDSEVGFHALDQGTEIQMSRFREVMISASSSELLAEKYDLDSDAAYSAAMLRQLGYTLIAWNYPGVYADAMRSLKASGDSLDLVLTRRLGFSPNTLALKVVQSWGLKKRDCSAIGLLESEELDEEEEIIKAIGATLSKVCRVGEALARASDPEHYPTAANDWDQARVEIESKLGSNGMQMIREKFAENCENYLTHLPHLFEPGLITEINQPQDWSADAHPEERNPYLMFCEPAVQTELRSLYRRLIPSKLSRENIRKLINHTIPAAGFSAGCIYTIDPGLMLLVPQVEVGEMKLRTAEPIDYSVVRSNSDMVAIAYQSSEPVLAYRKSKDGSTLTAIAGMIGSSQRIGVMYLEIPSAVTNDPKSTEMIHFKALCHALNDCLILS
ncbi:MAG: HDOD domain-containing protein, partial [Bdellovibrionales bacterium]|nr:HDOD domain-containing protein [Bdellovibrionales bacterium]